MATAFSIDMLKGACLLHELPVNDGDTAEDLTQRLGLHIVTKLLKPDVKKRKATSAPSRSASAWYAFMRSEKPNVLASGFTTRAEQIKEIARRYKIAKTVGTSGAPLALMMPPSDTDTEPTSPLALMPPSESDADEATDGLMYALKELDQAELNAAMAAHGLPIDGSEEEKVAALARAMMA